MKQLSEKQLRFVELWTGNATDTAQLAGYSNPRQAGFRCMKNVDICRLIADKRSQEIHSDIMDRIALQKMWTEFALNAEKADKDRLKASEHLAKSQGLFLDRVENSGEISLSIKWAD